MREPSVLLQAVAHDDNLLRAWEVVRDNDLADGVVAEPVERFARQLSVRLGRMSDELRLGTYQPFPLTRVEIPKEDGSLRRLGIPAVADRVVERALVQVLVPVLDPRFSPWSFAFRPGLGIADAVRSLVALRDEGRRFVVRSDFRDCFDRLDRGVLLADLADHLAIERAGDLVDLVALLLSRPERIGGRVVTTIVGATQGGPLSPLLCNLLLDRFDRAMLGRGWPPIRYADDLAIPVRDRHEAAAALAAAREEAARVSLDLGEEKTDVREFSEGFAFLGEDVNHRYPESLPHELRPTPDRRTLYVGRQGSMVRLRKGQVVVEDRGSVLLTVPMSLVSHLVVFGSVLLSPAVIAEAGRSGWTVVWLSRRGWLHGWLDGPHQARSALRRRQYQTGDQDAVRLDFARRFVAGKLANQRALLARYVRRDAIPIVVGAVESLGEARRSALTCERLEALLGIEGSAARCYFDAFGRLLPDWCDFDGRTKRPPRDPANAVLSFLYSAWIHR